MQITSSIAIHLPCFKSGVIVNYMIFIYYFDQDQYFVSSLYTYYGKYHHGEE